jgi:ketosteroid isomerase-like protein
VQSNWERTRLGYEAMNRGDFDAVLENVDPDVVWVDELPDQRGEIGGREAVKQVWNEAFEAFDDVRFETEEFIDGGDRIFHAIRLTGKGRGSGAPTEMRWYQVSFMGPGGLTIRFENYFDRARALEAAGAVASAQRIETVRRWLAAISTVDFDGASALVDPDVVLVPPGGQPPYRGAESLRRWMEPDAFQGQVAKLLQAIVAADGTILASHHVSARGTRSGIELDTVSWSVWSFRDDGLITRIEIHLDRDEAHQAAGLRT